MVTINSILGTKSPSIPYKTQIFDLLFPPLCPGCGNEPRRGQELCSSCAGDIDYLEDLSTCGVCGVPFGYFKGERGIANDQKSQSEKEHLCSKCVKGRYSFNTARSVAIYRGALREMVHAFKYEGKLNLGGFLSNIMRDRHPFKMDEFDVLLPVPLYIKKLRRREYNQSSVLASHMARSTGVRVDHYGLIKVRDTLPQIEIRDEAGRRKNVRGAFKVRDGSSYSGLSILLIDDVFTTGSTSDECAKTLLKSGALSVDVLTLSRAGGVENIFDFELHVL